MIDRGPEGRLHLGYRDGCWTGDALACCGVCWVRLLAVIARRVWRDA
jgi:hypothetical protein